jgi:hypothetical protein
MSARIVFVVTMRGRSLARSSGIARTVAVKKTSEASLWRGRRKRGKYMRDELP